MKRPLSLLAFVLPLNAFGFSLVSDPIPTTTVPLPTDCRFYFDAASPIKLVVQQCTAANPCPMADGTTKGTGYQRCAVDLSTVTLANGDHSVTATHYITHPTTPAESVKSNAVTFTWPIPPVPGTPAAPGILRLVP